MQQTAAQSEANAPGAFTPRQNDVLQTALNMLVEGGDRALTTGAIARAANCSKESLYKWFGDRDGMLAAVISYQASKVRVLAPGEAPGTRSEFRDHLVRFADDLMRVLSGDVSLALNRLAIGQAGNQDAHLGQLVRERGRQAIGQRAGALLETGRQRGYLNFDDREDAFQTLYGLIVRDQHVRQLLGEQLAGGQRDFNAQAEVAIDRFFRLFGADNGEA